MPVCQGGFPLPKYMTQCRFGNAERFGNLTNEISPHVFVYYLNSFARCRICTYGINYNCSFYPNRCLSAPTLNP